MNLTNNDHKIVEFSAVKKKKRYVGLQLEWGNKTPMS